MLGKNEKKSFFDAHFHLADCMSLPDTPLSLSGLTRQSPFKYTACSCSHSIEEWQKVQSFEKKENIIFSYGLHPQSAGFINIKECADFLESLLQKNQIAAIGEAGFDYFTKEFKDQAEVQEEIFNIQLDLALKYKKPLVIHCRKANHKLFEYSRQLKKLPSVLFHSFMGPEREARSLLNHGINSYFSFGKQLMNNNKKVLECGEKLPLSCLLLETDAPFQFLKGEKYTSPSDIERIYQAFFNLRSERPEAIYLSLENNFINLFLQNTTNM